MYINDLKSEYLLAQDSDDRWGSSMGAMFAVCAEIYTRHPTASVLWKFNYNPGAASDPREPEDYWYDIFIECDTGTLIAFANILNRYTRMVASRGEDY